MDALLSNILVLLLLGYLSRLYLNFGFIVFFRCQRRMLLLHGLQLPRAQHGVDATTAASHFGQSFLFLKELLGFLEIFCFFSRFVSATGVNVHQTLWNPIDFFLWHLVSAWINVSVIGVVLHPGLLIIRVVDGRNVGIVLIVTLHEKRILPIDAVENGVLRWIYAELVFGVSLVGLLMLRHSVMVTQFGAILTFSASMLRSFSVFLRLMFVYFVFESF